MKRASSRDTFSHPEKKDEKKDDNFLFNARVKSYFLHLKQKLRGLTLIHSRGNSWVQLGELKRISATTFFSSFALA